MIGAMHKLLGETPYWVIAGIFLVVTTGIARSIFFEPTFLETMLFFSIFLLHLFIVAFKNLKAFGFFIVCIGGFSNWLVVMANGGMPIPKEATHAPPVGYTIIGEDTVLVPLADILKSGFSYFSLGDVIVVAGLFIFLAQIVYIASKSKKEQKTVF